MNWGKTKALLIALLIAANLLAVVMYAGLRYEKTVLPTDMIENAVENLQSKGVSVRSDAIMQKKQSMAIYTASMERPENCAQILEKALDLILPGKGEYLSSEIPDGIAKVKKNASEEASASLASDSRITAISSKLSDTERESILGVRQSLIDFSESVSVDAACVNRIDSFYSAVAKNAKRGTASFSFHVFGKRERKSGTVYFCVQTADSVALTSYISRFFFSENSELLLVDGFFFIGNAEKSYSATLLDGVNLVYKMDLVDVSEIVKESSVFSVIAIEGENYYFVPSYSVIYKDKNGNIVNHIYDSVTGELKSKY